MKSLFQNIRSGTITKQACEQQVGKYKHDKMVLTREYLARHLGADLYRKKLAECNFAIELLQTIVDKFDDLKLPLKVAKHNAEEIEDEGPNYSGEG